jgi:hypothetical protein
MMRLKLLLLLGFSVFANALSAADYTFLNVASTSTDRRYSAGEWGGRFWNTSGEIVTITHVGRWIFNGNSQTHLIRVYGDFGELLGSATVDCSGTPGTWAWAALPSPVTVAVGYRVYILSEENLTDQWSNPFGGSGYSATDGDIGNFETGKNAGTPESPDLRSDGGLQKTYGPVNFRYSTPEKTWTKDGTTYTTNGEYYQISSAIADASPGDTINIPAGTYTWGAGGTSLDINKAVTVQGVGTADTIINQSATAPTGFGASLIRLGTGATFRRATINGANILGIIFTTGASANWRISEVKYVQYPGRNMYFLFAQYAPRGLIDQCDITGGAGNSELVFARGPADAWDITTPVGTENNIFIEDSTFRGLGYVCDANSNGRIVVRNCTITGSIKVDSHGVWTNGGPQRGARSMETYRNTWTLTSGTWPAIEYRGGTGMIWGNTSDMASGANGAWFYLTEYGLNANNGAFTPNYQTAYDYPIRDQIGRGQYAVAGDWTTATSEPVYLWSNVKGGAQWAFSYKAIAAGAQTRYQEQTGNPSATFGWEDVIQADRDYFRDVAGFDGSTGMGVGPIALRPVTPTKTGVGFWVTDEGEWDSTNGATPDGRLYRWNGSAWALHYTPYAYPHPQRGALAAPSFLSHPTSQAVLEGANVTLFSTISSNPSSTLQWKKDGTNVSGATSETLIINGFSAGNAGTYTVTATNSEGSATSDGAVLTLDSPTPVVSAPNFNLATGDYVRPVALIITSDTLGVTFYYTADGTDPDFNDNLYEAPISLPLGVTTYKARGYKAEHTQSSVTSATFTVSQPASQDAPVAIGTATAGTLNILP